MAQMQGLGERKRDAIIFRHAMKTWLGYRALNAGVVV